MMISEFIDLTGIEPTMEEYALIEERYYDFKGDKRAFCAAFVKKNSMIDVVRELVEKYAAATAEANKALRAEKVKGANLVKMIDDLKEQLDKELEWQPWTDKDAVPQKDYDELRAFAMSGGAYEMTDEQAKDWIADEFGFAPAKIHILRKKDVREVNRHKQLRRVGEIDRVPVYSATDWYYVYFSVAGFEYEAYNGSLIQI